MAAITKTVSFFLRPSVRVPPSSLRMARRSLSSDIISKLECLTVKEVKPFVYSVALNRPKKRNAMDETMWKEIGSVFKSLGEDPDCRSIVLSGEGSMFTAGIDLSFLMGMGAKLQDDELDVARKGRIMFNTVMWMQQCFTELEECPKPVIAAVHSACVGGGIDLITAADVRLCTEDAWFSVKEVDLGLAADVGTLQRLPKIVGNQSLVRELCLTARRFESAEADKAGMVSKVFPDKETMMSAAIEMASDIASKSPVAVQGTKVNLNYTRDNTVKDGLVHIARWNSLHLQSQDLLQAAMGALSKAEEPPLFSKL